VAFDRSPEVYLDFMCRRGLDSNALGRWYDLTEPFVQNEVLIGHSGGSSYHFICILKL
jgi:hypothetical protein